MSGHAEVAGLDVTRQANALRARIGLAGQYAAVDDLLTGRENLEMFGRLYHLRGRDARQRAGELLERFELADAAGRIVKTYSGGMRRRLDLAASLIVAPPVLFLDEPTTGLDPRGRQDMWELISRLVADGTTVLLTTQYLEEADLLADQIVVVDHGLVIARGTSDELKAQVGGERLEIVVARRGGQEIRAALDAAVRVLSPYAQGEPVSRRRASARCRPSRQWLAPAGGGSARSDAAGVQVDDLALRRPTLDDVFLTLTGHEAEQAPAPAPTVAAMATTRATAKPHATAK